MHKPRQNKNLIYHGAVLLLSAMFFLRAAPCHAENSSAATKKPAADTPIKISAATSLQWNRMAQNYVAKGDVHVEQGALTITCDTLTAAYTDNKASNLTTLTAQGHVVITSAPYTAYGSTAVYDVAQGQATLRGDGLRVTTPQSVLTAQKNIIFSREQNRLTANGAVHLQQGDDTLTAPTASAFFAPDTDGKLVLDHITAGGGVEIKTPRGTVYGDSGLYSPNTQKAQINGHVRVLQDRGELQGTRADIDLRTGISQLFSQGNDTTPQGRVTGVFYPDTSQNGTSQTP